MPNPVERLAAEAMGAAKDAKAAFKGLTGVFPHLMEEHGKLSALIMRVGMSSDAAVHAKSYPTIVSQLLAHEKAETIAVYPVLAEYAELSGVVMSHAGEAHELETALAQVDALAFGAPAWAPAFERLARLVQAHVDREESEFFPKAQRVIGAERAQQLLAAFEAAKLR